MTILITPDTVEKLMQEAEDSLVNDDPSVAADALLQLAHIWATAGIPQSSFNDIRQHIIQRAIDRTAPAFIQEKLQLIERERYADRQKKQTSTNAQEGS